MRVSLIRTGGFGGIPLSVELDTEALPDGEREALERLVEQADFAREPTIGETPRPGADRFTYRISVEDSSEVHAVTVQEAGAPAEMRRLIEWLAAAARRKRLAG